MRKLLIALTVLGTLTFSGCMAGPQYLRRSLDDLDHQVYVENPIVDGILWFPIPAFPIGYWLSYIGDFFINGYPFWFKDVWSGDGTGFIHADVDSKKSIKSLVRDDSEFFNFEGEGY